MKVILQKTYQNLGQRGDIKDVAPGFARNFLIPQNIALPATDSNVTYIQNLVNQEKKKEKALLRKLKSLKDKIEGLSLEIKAQALKGGKLFGSVNKKEIQKALKKEIDILVPKQKIDLRKPIKKLGEYEVSLNISPKFKPKFQVRVVNLELKRIG